MLNSRLHLLSPFREKYDYFLQYLGYFCQKTEESQVKMLESKSGKSYFIHTISGQPHVKKILIPTFSSFAATDHKGHFRRILTRIFKFGRFSWYHTYIFEKCKLDFLIDAESNGTHFKSQI